MVEQRQLLKIASEQLLFAGEVIEKLATYAMELEHRLAARDTAIKLAAAGRIPAVELAEKVAEFEQKDADELAMEEKLASYDTAPTHNIATDLGDAAGSSLLDIIS